MERRHEILRAAARVFARHGYRGSTTRRIADEAGVNEITLFRQFGTKDALIHEAIACCGVGGRLAELPEHPVDPHHELLAWSNAIREHIAATRMLMRRCMSERDDHPALVASANRGPVRASRDLEAYLSRLIAHGFTHEQFDVSATAAMLIGSLFADTMGRDAMPEMYKTPMAEATESYVTLLLRGIGVRESTAADTHTR